jgi:hypothetical protein
LSIILRLQNRTKIKVTEEVDTKEEEVVIKVKEVDIKEEVDKGWIPCVQYGGGHGQGRFDKAYYFICLKEDHLSLEFPMKDITNLKFCNICGVGDHSLEDYQIMLEKLRNRRTINLLQTMCLNMKSSTPRI